MLARPTSLLSPLLPELRHFAPGERASAMREACTTEMDLLELAGIAALLVVVTWATRHALPADVALAGRITAFLLNLAIALPLLAAGALPLHLRRVRRGLRDQLARREAP